MAYKRLSFEERNSIFKFMSLGLSQKEIAGQLGRSKSTLCDELHRFKKIKQYTPQLAHLDADKNPEFANKLTRQSKYNYPFYVPTLVFYEEGNKKDIYAGLLPKEALTKIINKNFSLDCESS